MKINLINELKDLMANYGVIGVKGGTEVEDMTFKEIAELHNLLDGLLPLTIKIGGPEARNDIRNLIDIGVECILGPMIESAYGLKNFANAVNDFSSDINRPFRAVNIETITTYQNYDKMVADKSFQDISFVTVGRNDLASSVEKHIDGPEVTEMAEYIVRKAKELNKLTSVGGKVSVNNIDLIKGKIQPDRINTRHIYIDVKELNNPKEAIEKALLFEVKLYEFFKTIEPGKSSVYDKRINTVNQRIFNYVSS